MAVMRASLPSSRAVLRPRVQPIPRLTSLARRAYADQSQTPSQKSSSSFTPFLIGGVAIGVPAFFYLLQNKQPDVAKSDHSGQASIHTSQPDVHKMSTKDIPAKADASQSDLQNDAPNNPENKEKMETKQQLKPASKKVDPMK